MPFKFLKSLLQHTAGKIARSLGRPSSRKPQDMPADQTECAQAQAEARAPAPSGKDGHSNPASYQNEQSAQHAGGTRSTAEAAAAHTAPVQAGADAGADSGASSADSTGSHQPDPFLQAAEAGELLPDPCMEDDVLSPAMPEYCGARDRQTALRPCQGAFRLYCGAGKPSDIVQRYQHLTDVLQKAMHCSAQDMQTVVKPLLLAVARMCHILPYHPYLYFCEEHGLYRRCLSVAIRTQYLYSICLQVCAAANQPAEQGQQSQSASAGSANKSAPEHLTPLDELLQSSDAPQLCADLKALALPASVPERTVRLLLLVLSLNFELYRVKACYELRHGQVPQGMEQEGKGSAGQKALLALWVRCKPVTGPIQEIWRTQSLSELLAKAPEVQEQLRHVLPQRIMNTLTLFTALFLPAGQATTKRGNGKNKKQYSKFYKAERALSNGKRLWQEINWLLINCSSLQQYVTEQYAGKSHVLVPWLLPAAFVQTAVSMPVPMWHEHGRAINNLPLLTLDILQHYCQEHRSDINRPECGVFLTQKGLLCCQDSALYKKIKQLFELRSQEDRLRHIGSQDRMYMTLLTTGFTVSTNLYRLFSWYVFNTSSGLLYVNGVIFLIPTELVSGITCMQTAVPCRQIRIKRSFFKMLSDESAISESTAYFLKRSVLVPHELYNLWLYVLLSHSVCLNCIVFAGGHPCSYICRYLQESVYSYQNVYVSYRYALSEWLGIEHDFAPVQTVRENSNSRYRRTFIKKIQENPAKQPADSTDIVSTCKSTKELLQTLQNKAPAHILTAGCTGLTFCTVFSPFTITAAQPAAEESAPAAGRSDLTEAELQKTEFACGNEVSGRKLWDLQQVTGLPVTCLAGTITHKSQQSANMFHDKSDLFQASSVLQQILQRSAKEYSVVASAGISDTSPADDEITDLATAAMLPDWRHEFAIALAGCDFNGENKFTILAHLAAGWGVHPAYSCLQVSFADSIQKVKLWPGWRDKAYFAEPCRKFGQRSPIMLPLCRDCMVTLHFVLPANYAACTVNGKSKSKIACKFLQYSLKSAKC